MKKETLPRAERKLRQVMAKRWAFIRGRYTKLLRVRPASSGDTTYVFIRKAIVTVPEEVLENLSEVDLAMVVASGPGFIHYHVEPHHKSSLRNIRVGDDSQSFLVTVIMNPSLMLAKSINTG